MQTQPAQTVAEILERGAESAVAVAAPERPPLTFAALRRLAMRTAATLRDLDFGDDTRIAIVLPNGPEMATTFVSVAACATAAPLNPAYRKEEFHFYLSDLGARALLVERGSDSVAIEVAHQMGMAVLEVAIETDRPAGWFRLDGADTMAATRDPSGRPDATALVLHTSGTTSRPKIVPLSQRNLAASAQHIVEALSLTSVDRCLNVMPLFHIHGLMAAVMGSLAAGASVYCTAGFDALRFFGSLANADPTWYTAVPTMHQAILARSQRNREVLTTTRLRFVRSSSASLPPQIMTALEQVFECPVIESYGMTEAAHQMTSNPVATATPPTRIGRYRIGSRGSNHG